MSDERITAAAEAAEDSAWRWLGRDLGTIHRDDIAADALAAADAWDRERGYLRIKVDDALVERIADRIGAARRQPYEAWRRDESLPDGGEFYMTEPGNGDDVAMETFPDSDGYYSTRPLTWREIVPIVVAALREAAQ